MPKIATARKDISPLIKKGSRLVRKGKYGILEGHETRERIKMTDNTGREVSPPNFYPWEEIEQLKVWWKVSIEKNPI